MGRQQGRLRALGNWVIRRWFFLAFPLLLVVFVVMAAAGGQLAPVLEDLQDGGNATDYEIDEERVEALVHERINDIRVNHSLPPLDHSVELRQIASNYSRKMATQGFYGHKSPSGETFEDRYQDAGYTCRVSTGHGVVTGAENIQYTYAFTEVVTGNETAYYKSERELANAIVENWMQSPQHREIILKDYWLNEGIGVYAIDTLDSDGVKVYVTQNFC